MSYKLYLDDIRQPQASSLYMHSRIGKDNPIYLEEWIVVKNYEEFVSTIEEKGLPTHISFDHDLAEIHYDSTTQKESFKYYEKTGEDCAKWLVKYLKENNLKMPTVYIHSQNPIGCENIKNALNN